MFDFDQFMRNAFGSSKDNQPSWAIPAQVEAENKRACAGANLLFKQVEVAE